MSAGRREMSWMRQRDRCNVYYPPSAVSADVTQLGQLLELLSCRKISEENESEILQWKFNLNNQQLGDTREGVV